MTCPPPPPTMQCKDNCNTKHYKSQYKDYYERQKTVPKTIEKSIRRKYITKTIKYMTCFACGNAKTIHCIAIRTNPISLNVFNSEPCSVCVLWIIQRGSGCLCIVFVHCLCILYLCIVFVYCLCILYLCIVFVYCIYVLSLCIVFCLFFALSFVLSLYMAFSSSSEGR